MPKETRAAGARRGWEHRRESDERVAVNVPPELLPLWRSTRGIFRGTPDARFRAFMDYAHDHEREAIVELEAEADAKLARSIKEHVRTLEGLQHSNNGDLQAWLNEQDVAQEKALHLRRPAARKRSLASAEDGARLLPMARTAARRSMTRLRPVTVKPVVVKQTKVIKPKRKGHRRSSARGMLGGLLSENRTQIAIAGGIVGLIDKQGWSIPHLPWVGEHGTIALGAYMISDNGRNKMADNVCTAALVISLYELGKEGHITGGDWDDPDAADALD